MNQWLFNVFQFIRHHRVIADIQLDVISEMMVKHLMFLADVSNGCRVYASQWCMGIAFEEDEPIITRWDLPIKYDLNQSSAVPPMLNRETRVLNNCSMLIVYNHVNT